MLLLLLLLLLLLVVPLLLFLLLLLLYLQLSLLHSVRPSLSMLPIFLSFLNTALLFLLSVPKSHRDRQQHEGDEIGIEAILTFDSCFCTKRAAVKCGMSVAAVVSGVAVTTVMYTTASAFSLSILPNGERGERERRREGERERDRERERRREGERERENLCSVALGLTRPTIVLGRTVRADLVIKICCSLPNRALQNAGFCELGVKYF